MFEVIAIIEKSSVIREGLCTILKAHNVCAHTIMSDSVDDAAHMFKETPPDLIIINPEQIRDGVNKAKSKYKIDAGIPVVAFVYQFFDKETLAPFNESIYITDTEDVIISKLRNSLQSGDTTGDKLTEREKHVLRFLLQGLSNKEVAARLNISPHTVITHRKNIIEKTGIRSLSGLAIYAILNNIANIEEIRN